MRKYKQSIILAAAYFAINMLFDIISGDELDWIGNAIMAILFTAIFNFATYTTEKVDKNKD